MVLEASEIFSFEFNLVGYYPWWSGYLFFEVRLSAALEIWHMNGVLRFFKFMRKTLCPLSLSLSVRASPLLAFAESLYPPITLH